MKQLHRKLHSLIQKGRRAQMKTMSIAIKNLKKSFSFYALYLLSVSLVITVFFAFTSFSMNEVMLEKISENGRVETMCSAISVFLMVFVVFYMAYSNKFFLRRRTKELGIYALLPMTIFHVFVTMRTAQKVLKIHLKNIQVSTSCRLFFSVTSWISS